MYEELPDCQGARVEAYLNLETAGIELHAFQSSNTSLEAGAELVYLFVMDYIDENTYPDDDLCLDAGYTAEDLSAAIIGCWIDYSVEGWEIRSITSEIWVHYQENFNCEEIEGEKIYTDPRSLKVVEINMQEDSVTVDNDHPRACSLEEAGLGGIETPIEILEKLHEDLVAGDSPLQVVFGLGEKGEKTPVCCVLKSPIGGQTYVQITKRKTLSFGEVYSLADLYAEIDFDATYDLAPCYWGEMLQRKFHYNGSSLHEI